MVAVVAGPLVLACGVGAPGLCDGAEVAVPAVCCERSVLLAVAVRYTLLLC